MDLSSFQNDYPEYFGGDSAPPPGGGGDISVDDILREAGVNP